MVTLVLFHHVQDYAGWKTVFDEVEALRRSHGAVAHRVYRGVDNQNRVIVHIDFPDEAGARSFMADPSLSGVMERAGVTDEPWLGLVVQLEQKRYTDDVVGVTAAVHHRVRDYAVWKAVFDDHERVRRSHGQIEHRIYHAWGDPLQIVIHGDFPSLEAAESLCNDPSVADAMARGGVEGEPGIGFITLAERKSYASVA